MIRRPAFVLLRLGRRAGARSQAGSLRYTAMALATLAMGVAALAFAAVHLTYAARAQREIARAPITHLADSPGRPVALWGAGFDTVGERQYSVVFLEPLTPGAPLPPGVTAWPAPGQAVLSPALIKAGRREDIGARFGTVAGVIGRAGLSAPGERLAYVRPADGLAPTGIMQEIDGFGSPSQPPLGDGLFVQSESTFHVVVAFLILLPALVLLLVAARTGASGRDQRFALITTLGGGRGARALISLGDAVLPVATGLVGGLAFATVLAGFDITIPVVGYQLAAADLRDSAGTLIAAVTLAGLVTLGVIVAADQVGVRRHAGNRPTGVRRTPVRVAALFPVALLVATRGPGLFAPASPLHMITNYVGVAGTLLTLPALVGLGAKLLGSQLALVAKRWRLGGSLLAGRWMAAQPAALARATAGIVAAVCILVQVQVWTSFLGSPVRDARAAVAVAGDGLQILKVKSDASPRQLDAFYRAVNGDAWPITLVNDPSVRSLRVVGSCPALEQVGLPCTLSAGRRVQSDQPRMRMLLAIAGSPDYPVIPTAGDPAAVTAGTDSFALAVLVARGTGALDRPALEAAAYRTLPGGADISDVGGDWLVGASVNDDHGRWVTLFGEFGLFVLALACTLGALGEYVRWSRVLAPVSVLAGNRRVFFSGAAWSVFVPILLAGAVSLPVAFVLALPETEDGRSSVSVDLLRACLVGILLLGLAIYLWALKASRDISRRWLPRGD